MEEQNAKGIIIMKYGKHTALVGFKDSPSHTESVLLTALAGKLGLALKQSVASVRPSVLLFLLLYLLNRLAFELEFLYV